MGTLYYSEYSPLGYSQYELYPDVCYRETYMDNAVYWQSPTPDYDTTPSPSTPTSASSDWSTCTLPSAYPPTKREESPLPASRRLGHFDVLGHAPADGAKSPAAERSSVVSSQARTYRLPSATCSAKRNKRPYPTHPLPSSRPSASKKRRIRGDPPGFVRSEEWEVEQWLREQSFLEDVSPDVPITLTTLQDSRILDGRPPYSMYQLIAVAIFTHPLKRARASEIRKLLGERFPYFIENKKELGETLKHALSSYELFHRVERASGDKERGCQWELDVRTNPCGRRTRTRTLTPLPDDSKVPPPAVNAPTPIRSPKHESLSPEPQARPSPSLSVKSEYAQGYVVDTPDGLQVAYTPYVY